jgi:hypothetical protein
MADRRPVRTPLLLSPEALFRYQIISAVKARVLSGQRMDAAVREIAAQTHLTPAGGSTTVSVRSIYRWLAESDRDEPADPEPTEPARVISQTLTTTSACHSSTKPSPACTPPSRPACARR